MQKLSLDISTFSELRTSDYLYIDKTEYIHRMITGGRRFFLSRPRRFGKSLLVSTIKEVLTANKSLFHGLWIESSDYQWHEYGVINLDFSLLSRDSITNLHNTLKRELLLIAQYYKITIDPDEDHETLLIHLVRSLFDRFGKVAILIDEYDSPILKTLYNEERAKEIRDSLQQFFTIIKGLDQYVQFVFITGVSAFAKAGLFSGINNLQILTLRDEYAAICGYTDEEIDHYFHNHMLEWTQKKDIPFDDLRKQIKQWYNGYHFGYMVPAVYNPFSFMNALAVQKFENFWFQSGTPQFLVEALKKKEYTFDPTDFTMSRDSLGIFEIGKTPLITLMFQAGYLSIVDYNDETQEYRLDYPNKEVQVSFQKYLLEVFINMDAVQAESLSFALRKAFVEEDIEGVVELLYQLFIHVPYQLHIKKEKYYHSLFMMICIGAQIKVQSEYSTSLGSIDLVLEFSKIIYVIEVKFNKSPEEALEQIKARKYYERFLHEGKTVILLGLAFKKEPSNFDITYVVEKL